MSPAHFLKHYWQKRPLLVRGAFPNFRDPVTADELAGFSCETDVASRLVMERGGKKPWQVTPGPQKAAQLRKLPRSHWTLLVQGVDRLVPGVAKLLEPFRFIPDWRVDDVMISVAPRGGTVGPHLDSYDVFLLQGQGRRRWRLDRKAPPALKPGLDLRILKQFHAQDDWVLESGDMLYLPPQIAHYGVALEECLTYSIGFRAPNGPDLLAAALQRLTQSDSARQRYRDPGLTRPRFSGEIPRQALRELRRLMETSLQGLSDADFDALAGELLTEPKGSSGFEDGSLSAAALRSKLMKGATLARSPGSRLGFLRRGLAVELYADGRRFPLERSLVFAAALLSEERRIPAHTLVPHLRKQAFVQLLAALVNAGTFQIKNPR